MAGIYKKEMRSYFRGLMGWVFLALILLTFGIYTSVLCLSKGFADFSLVPYNAQFVFLIAIPLLTMRSLAEERRQHTDQLLYSSSLSSAEIVIGKYLSCVTILALPLVISCLYPLVLSGHGRVVLETTFSTMLAFFLLGCVLTAIGLFFSALSTNQFVSAAISFCALLFCYFANDLGSLLSTSIAAAFYFFSVLAIAAVALLRVMTKNWLAAGVALLILEGGLLLIYLFVPTILDGSVAAAFGSIAVFAKLETFSNGILNITVLLQYVSLAWLFVFFTIQAVEKRRWS
ncbi:MAG: ABC transporter [Firmicutes bacterium HGW-Firmicutes-9]|jgi:ABC-2 type transport system permease protein|nr:MAG: ABC transporter [Firmicutes bacterium HGW-Firmicutes-9]